MLYKRCECERKAWPRCEHVYWHKFKHRGQPLRRSTGQRDRKEAEKKAREERVEIERTSGPGGRRSGVALELLEGLDIKRVLDKGYGERREADIGGLWKPLLRILGSDRDVMSLTEADIDSYEGARRRESNGRGGTVRGQTIREEVQALRRGIRLAVRDRVIPRSPINWDLLETIESDEPDERQASKPWTDAEIRLAMKHLSKKALTAGILDLCAFADEVGLRLEELRRYEKATWLRGRELHVPATGAKTGHKGARVITLKKSALRIAKRWPKFNIGKPNKALKLACIKAGLVTVDEAGRVLTGKVLTPRDLRAHRITKWAKISPLAAQRLAGHTNIATTSRYLHPDAALIRRTSLAGERRKGAQPRGHGQQDKRKSSAKSKRARSSTG